MTWNKDRIQELRRRLGLTQMEFASLLGCRQQTVSEWEVGLYEPANAYRKLLEQLSFGSLVPQHSVLRAEMNASVSPQIQKIHEPSLPEPVLPEEDFEIEFDKGFDPAID